MTEYAVLFEWPVFRGWLAQPRLNSIDGRPNGEAVDALSTAYQPLDSEAGWLVEQTLNALRVDGPVEDGTHPWVYGPGVGDLRVWTVAGVEGGADGLVGEVTVDGVKLSLGHLSDKELLPTQLTTLPGYEAAEVALFRLAERINDVATHFRARPAGGAADDDDDVVDAEIVED